MYNEWTCLKLNIWSLAPNLLKLHHTHQFHSLRHVWTRNQSKYQLPVFFTEMICGKFFQLNVIRILKNKTCSYVNFPFYSKQNHQLAKENTKIHITWYYMILIYKSKNKQTRFTSWLVTMVNQFLSSYSQPKYLIISEKDCGTDTKIIIFIFRDHMCSTKKFFLALIYMRNLLRL